MVVVFGASVNYEYILIPGLAVKDSSSAINNTNHLPRRKAGNGEENRRRDLVPRGNLRGSGGEGAAGVYRFGRFSGGGALFWRRDGGGESCCSSGKVGPARRRRTTTIEAARRRRRYHKAFQLVCLEDENAIETHGRGTVLHAWNFRNTCAGIRLCHRAVGPRASYWRNNRTDSSTSP